MPFFNALDAFSYNNQGIWHQNAVVAEAISFDGCEGHPQMTGVYHHHMIPTCLLNELGDTPAIKRFLTDLIESPVLSGRELATHIADPVLGGFLIAKQAEARETNTTLSLEIEPVIPVASNTADVQAAVGVLGNLIDNALDALAGMAPAREPRVIVALAWEGDILSLSVSDNGCGMTPAQTERATIHGFTTKGGQRGLGLSLVARRLADMGQPLRIYSTPGAGTLVEANLVFEAQA